ASATLRARAAGSRRRSPRLPTPRRCASRSAARCSWSTASTSTPRACRCWRPTPALPPTASSSWSSHDLGFEPRRRLSLRCHAPQPALCPRREQAAMSDKPPAKMLSVEPLIDRTAEVRKSTLGRYTEVGARTSLLEVDMADYSYVVNDSDIAYAGIGKFCS